MPQDSLTSHHWSLSDIGITIPGARGVRTSKSIKQEIILTTEHNWKWLEMTYLMT